ncbi:MAG TPA: glycoside hydrolase family 3 C-terminal domain-containing protein [Opitutaceae bacterium]|nr:glycoside hydrolase family 3 C-terminal domain-containing protein [Opitutaceae bacterium]
MKTCLITILSVVSTLVARAAATDAVAVDQRADAIISRMTLEQKIDLIGGVDDFYIRGYESIGWPRLRMADGPMGVRNLGPATAYPAGIGLAATWDPEMARQIGAGIGRDARAKGVHFLLGPGVNLYRAPLNGRNFEYFGEDPWLGARIAVGYIQGVQSQGVAATIKHYLANNSEYDRNHVNSEIDERTAREIYLPIFEAAVKEAHVGAIMDSYNLINGEHATQNRVFNTDIPKTDWGFRGIIMSDWGATHDGIAAANAGLDLEMPSGQFMNRATLLPAIRAGQVTVATIDDKVRRIVRTAVEFGFLDREQTDFALPRYSEENREVALRGAEESMVLLKNDGALLPLDPARIKTIAVLGPNAYPGVPVAGGSAAVEPFRTISFLEGISERLAGTGKVLYAGGLVPVDDILDHTPFTVDVQGTQPGLRGEYFANADFAGTPQIHLDPHVNFQWAGWGHRRLPLPEPPISIRWTGYFMPIRSGLHRWFVNAAGRDTCRLYLDGQLVNERNPAEDQVPQALELPMQAGRPYAVKFEFVVGPYWYEQRIGLGVIAAEDLVTPEAKRLAAAADAAVVCVGFNQDTEHEGADRSFALPAGQDELVQAAQAANPRTIVVLTAGGSVDATKWIDRVPAFLQTWYAGQEGGRALARILVGDVNPSGHLPITLERRWEDNPVHDSYYPNDGGTNVRYREGVFVGYRGYEHNGVKPLYPFGHGLSYTTFAFTNLAISPTAPKPGENVTVAFDVANTGTRPGAAVAQLYLGNPSAPVPRPVKELKGFAHVVLAPGQSTRVSLTLDPRARSYFDATAHAWKQSDGRFTVAVGHSSADIDLTGEFSVAK